MKKNIKFMAMGLFLGVLFGCGKEKGEIVELDKEKVYSIGTNAEYPPFEYLENGEIKGFDIELMDMVSEKIGIKHQWNNMNFDGIIPALQLKKVDVAIAGMSITPEREKAVDFSIPYLTSNVAFIANKNKPIDGIENLKNKVFGAELGTTKEAAARKIEGATVVPFTSNTAALVALKSGKIDVIVVDESVANNFVTNNDELMLVGCLDGEPKAIAFNKDSKLLKDAVNKALEELKAEGKIEALKEKYGI